MTHEPSREEMERVLRKLDPAPERNGTLWLYLFIFSLGFMLGMVVMGCIR